MATEYTELGEKVLNRGESAELGLSDSNARVMCSVCAGTGIPESEIPCVCGGAGTQEAELQGLRELVFELEAEVKRLKREQISVPVIQGEEEPVAMANWNSIDSLTMDDFVVLIFSEEWKDTDFNPEGIREGFRNETNDGPIVSAKWNGCYDCWDTEHDSKPTHWAPRPKGP